VTHNTEEALRLATRVIVLGTEGDDPGSRVRLDLALPDGCRENEIVHYGRLLEAAAQPGASAETGTALLSRS
jgi:ABC-type nitrate/sulfonate/bicarbonate transport system ATPase subunit